jgi:hypothetical protein
VRTSRDIDNNQSRQPTLRDEPGGGQRVVIQPNHRIVLDELRSAHRLTTDSDTPAHINNAS